MSALLKENGTFNEAKLRHPPRPPDVWSRRPSHHFPTFPALLSLSRARWYSRGVLRAAGDRKATPSQCAAPTMEDRRRLRLAP